MSASTVYPLLSLSPELKATLQECIERRLRDTVEANITTQYGIAAASLSLFHQAIAGKDVKTDPTIITDFRRAVPLTDYESYSPFVTRFFGNPRKLSELENILAPGLPSFIAMSSSTTGTKSKLLPKYPRKLPGARPAITRLLNAANSGKTAYIYSFVNQELLEVLGEDGDVMKKIPVCSGSCAGARYVQNWPVETDSTRVGTTVPGHVSPWATGLITHHRSFLLVHALFALSEPTLETFITTFLTLFVDLIHYIQEDWDMLITSIREGTIPDIDRIDHVRTYLQANFQANPQRAEELQNIGPPLTSPVWAQRVWPNVKSLVCVCSGMFAILIPKARSVLGPNVLIRNMGYGCTECAMGRMLNVDDNETPWYMIIYFKPCVFRYLSAVHRLTYICKSGTSSQGKCYQPVATTQDGLWRYLIDDVVQITGFDPRNGSPVFKFYGRKNLAIQFQYAAITEAHLVGIVQAINTEDIVKVQEFTAIVDQREPAQTVGFFLEIMGDTGMVSYPAGPSAKLARHRAFEALVATNEKHQHAFNTGKLRLPTIRIVKPGTFAKYRSWRGESTNADVGQIKVPVVMSNEAQQEWIVERVVTEL
ncbi:GH3 auxin-responsive promoter [Pisolithus marmoratus]|nr:GH3 auxin-responsive promoter [Pisolithus marmoratus]